MPLRWLCVLRHVWVCVILISFSHSARAEEKHIVVIIPSYNNAEWYERNLNSVLSQNYTNFDIRYIEDCWTVGAGLVQEYKDKHDTDNRMTLICNSERRGALANIYDAVYGCDDNDIILIVDGDDWLAHDEVLATINRYYQDPNVWLTYGQMRANDKNYVYNATIMSKNVIKESSYRLQRWKVYHPRTFYAGLFKRIKKEDLMYEGSFFPMTGDMAIMFPMLEMSGGLFARINEVIYIYNRSNPINVDKVNGALQIKFEKYIRALPRYEPLTPLCMCSVSDSVSFWQGKCVS